jgi:phosphohistidine swiveling domain-containing protein
VAQDRAEAWQLLGSKVTAAKQAYARQQQASPPWTPGGELDTADAADWLTGIPGSPGLAQGPAYIVRSPDDFAACPAGAMLIVRATTPAWTALFAKAAGIVAESGGPLSHGAIAAREHAIPAVMAVRGIMGLLSNGQAVTLDGGRGWCACCNRMRTRCGLRPGETDNEARSASLLRVELGGLSDPSLLDQDQRGRSTTTAFFKGIRASRILRSSDQLTNRGHKQ